MFNGQWAQFIKISMKLYHYIYIDKMINKFAMICPSPDNPMSHGDPGNVIKVSPLFALLRGNLVMQQSKPGTGIKEYNY